MDRLPPLRLLTTFESFARSGSMRLAATRLNVTQPAISQALKALEAHVGAILIDRNRKPAQLTEAGQILARAVRDGLGQISAAIEDARILSGQETAQVTVSCTIGMATYWLMPRLPEFYAMHPDITVNVQAPSSDLPHLAPGIDVAVRYGTGDWREGVTEKLFDERVCPVGAPDLIRQLLSQGVGLDQAPLIHVRSPNNQHWAGWESYLAKAGIQRVRLSGQTFNNYVQAAQAALDGRGLMLGWRSISQGAVRDGALEEWPAGQIDLRTAYYITTSMAPSEATIAFTRWVNDSSAAVDHE
jgi:DNA-binding transcriptional LysR family regulator